MALIDRRKKKPTLPKPRPKEYQRRSNGQWVPCTYIVVATRDSTSDDERRSKKKFKQGDIRIGSTSNCSQRLTAHRRWGWFPISIFTKRMHNDTERYNLERRQSRFYYNQSLEEEFDLINGDFQH